MELGAVADCVGIQLGDSEQMMLSTHAARSMMRGFDRVITPSGRMAERLAEKGIPADRIAILRNWVDLDHLKPLERQSPYRREYGIADGDCVVLYSGTLGVKQGFDCLLEAAAQLAKRTDIQFLIAGEGPAKSDLSQRYGQLPNVRFLPFQPYARLSEFLGVADLHVLPQAADAADLVLPSKLGGMLASGRRILVTAAAGTELADFLEGAAIVVPPGDVTALREAILGAAEGPPMAVAMPNAGFNSPTSFPKPWG